MSVNVIAYMIGDSVSYSVFSSEISVYDKDISEFKKDIFYECPDKVGYINQFSFVNRIKLSEFRNNLNGNSYKDELKNIWLYHVDTNSWYHSRFSDDKFVEFE